MSQRIGYQDGISGFVSYMRKIPGVRYRDPDDRPDKLEQWSWLEKFERTLKILKDDHDAAIVTDPPIPKPPDPPTYVRVAPRVAYAVGGSDARFCTVAQPGVVASGPPGHTIDESGATYDDNGLCKNGLRTGSPAVTSALEIDGRPYCSLPTTGNPQRNTGSWAI